MALQESFELSDGTGASIHGTTWGMQSWTTTSAYAITDVALYCYKFGSPGNITVSIRAIDGNGKPTGADLASVTVADSGISAFPTRAWYTFTFDTSYALDDATQYAIVFRATSGNGSNYFGPFGYGSTGYAGGGFSSSSNSGSSWGTVSTATDMDFRTYGEGVPEKPINPTPANNDTEVDFSGLTLSWEDGVDNGNDADTYDVWVGDSVDLYLVSEGQVDTNYVTTLDEVSSAYDGKIYWEVDATNAAGTTEGDIWNFDARPGQVDSFTPTNGATNLILSDVEVAWGLPSDNTDSYDVYFGIESGSLIFVDNTTLRLLELVNVFPAYDYTYYWVVNAVNDFGVTAGSEVLFTTIQFYPPTPPGVTWTDPGNNPGYTGTPTGENNMITIRRLVVAANSKIWIEDI